MTTPKARFAGLALIAALCAGVILGLTACTDEADFNAGVEGMLGVTRNDLTHLERRPHLDALRWRWERWSELEN